MSFVLAGVRVLLRPVVAFLWTYVHITLQFFL